MAGVVRGETPNAFSLLLLPHGEAEAAWIGTLVAAGVLVGDTGGAEDGVDPAHTGRVDGGIALLL